MCIPWDGNRTLPQDCTIQFSSVSQSLSPAQLSAPPGTATRQASLYVTSSQSLLKLMPIKSVMLSIHLILCCPLLLLPSIFPIIRVCTLISWLFLSCLWIPFLLWLATVWICIWSLRRVMEVKVCSLQKWKGDTERLPCPGAPQSPAPLQYFPLKERYAEIKIWNSAQPGLCKENALEADKIWAIS